jgi:hypothetical protein
MPNSFPLLKICCANYSGMRLESITNPTVWYNGSSTLPNYIILSANLDVWNPRSGFIFREFVIMYIFYTSYNARLSTMWLKLVACIGFRYMNIINSIMLRKLNFLLFKAYLKNSTRLEGMLWIVTEIQASLYSCESYNITQWYWTRDKCAINGT